MKKLTIQLSDKEIQVINLPETYKGNIQELANDMENSHRNFYDEQFIKLQTD